jgi:hypothetical protein
VGVICYVSRGLKFEAALALAVTRQARPPGRWIRVSTTTRLNVKQTPVLAATQHRNRVSARVALLLLLQQKVALYKQPLRSARHAIEPAQRPGAPESIVRPLAPALRTPVAPPLYNTL